MTKEKVKETLVNFVVPLLALVVILVMIFVIIIPTINSKPQKEEELAKAAALNQQLRVKLENLNKMKNLENVVGDYSQLVTRVLVDKPMVPELLTQVDTIASESGLTVTKLTYSFTEADKIASAGNAYPYINVSLGAEGSYEQLIAFFESLEKAARVVYVQNFRYSEENKETTNNLAIQITLASPYLEVESKPNTDEPVKIDISNKDFIALISELKKLKYYEPRVDLDVQEKATEESDEDTEPEEATKPNSTTTPVAPVVPTSTPPTN
ncbi:type 4a pilus biogenesis protein PilO [Patescibacteria group bacterium]|nr:type 4a pilus biogenesis protein PilO [Patescibacteria group bacterium]